MYRALRVIIIATAAAFAAAAVRPVAVPAQPAAKHALPRRVAEHLFRERMAVPCGRGKFLFCGQIARADCRIKGHARRYCTGEYDENGIVLNVIDRACFASGEITASGRSVHYVDTCHGG